MDGARLSRFPHLSWLRFQVNGGRTSRPLAVNMRGACHSLSLTAAGRHDVRWITRGREHQWSEGVGAVHFLPADDEDHTFLTRMSTDFVSRVLLLPREHLRNCLLEEGCEPACDTHRLLVHEAKTLQACLARLSTAHAEDENAVDGRCEEAARVLLLRIMELTGGGRPDWHDDESVFEARALRHLVNVIDEHLRIAPMLSGLDPGGTVLASFNNPQGGAGILDYTFTPTESFTLEDETKYWLYVAATTDNYTWYASFPSITPTGKATFGAYRYSSNGGSSWGSSTTLNSFQINGTVVVPEPTTYAMALAGVACGGYLVRRCRKRA